MLVRFKSIFAFIVAFPLLGCVNGGDIYKEEELVRQNKLLKNKSRTTPSPQGVGEVEDQENISSYENAVAYTLELAELYIKKAGGASTVKDVAAVGLLGAAGVAAGGLLYGANLDLIKGAGLAAGAISSTNSYLKPEEAEGAFLSAADALICIGGVAQSGSTSVKEGAEGAGVVTQAAMTVRLNLRKKLLRKLPDYSSLVDYMVANANIVRTASEGGGITDSNVLRSKVSECIMRAGA